MSLNIKELPVGERPREKALKYGVEVLSNQELLAILIRSGTAKCGVLEIASSLLEKGVTLNGLASLDQEELMEIDGISTIKAIELQTHFELAKRIAEEKLPNRYNVSSPESIYDYLRLKQGNKTQEEFMVIYLDEGYRIINMETLFKGSETCSVVSIREVLRRAILKGAGAIVIAHNHPTGLLQASNHDIVLTKKIVEASNFFNIEVLDHIIITEKGCISLKQEGVF